MKWHKASEELPPLDKLVLVAYLNWRDLYRDDTVEIVSHFGNGYWEEKSSGAILRIDDTDRWAYIELPED